MSALKEISANVGAFTTLTSSTIENSGDLTTNQFQLIPTVPSLGYTLTSSDDAGNATWTKTQYRAYVQKAPKINFNTIIQSFVVSSDGGMILACYGVFGAPIAQFQTFLYTSGAWVLDSTITTPLTANASVGLTLSDQNDLLSVRHVTNPNQLVVYRRIAGAWVQVGDMIDLGTTNVFFGRGSVINSEKQMQAITTDLGVSFYAIGASTVTFVGALTIASRSNLVISNDFLTLVTPNIVGGSFGNAAVYVRAASDPLMAWSLLQTITPLSVTGQFFGQTLAISANGSTLAVAMLKENLNAPASVGTTGAVLMFKYVTGVGFVQGQKIVPVDYSYQTTTLDFGISIQLSYAGDTLVVGGYLDQAQLGSLWVYVRNNRGLWIQNGNKLRGNDLTLANAQQGRGAGLAKGNASIVVSVVINGISTTQSAIVIFQ